MATTEFTRPTDYQTLRAEIARATRHATDTQHAIFLTGQAITLEYSLLGNLGDLLNAVTMLTHTIDRVRFDTRHNEVMQAAVRDGFLGSTS